MTQVLGYNGFHALIAADDLEWANSNGWTCMLLDDTYVFDADHQFVDDVSAAEVAGTGYTADGQALTGLTSTWVDPWYLYDCDDPEWDPSTITARYAVFYKDTGTPATSPLMMCLDAEENVSSAATPFVVPIDIGGLFRTGFGSGA